MDLHHVLTRLVTLLTALNCWAIDTCCQTPGKAPTARVCRCWQCQERHESHRHWIEQYFIHRYRARSASIVSVSTSWPAHLAPKLAQGDWLYSILLCSRWRTLFLSHQKQILLWGWWGAIWCTCFKQNKEVHMKSWIGKDNPRQVHTPGRLWGLLIFVPGRLWGLFIFVKANVRGPGHYLHLHLFIITILLRLCLQGHHWCSCCQTQRLFVIVLVLSGASQMNKWTSLPVQLFQRYHSTVFPLAGLLCWHFLLY